MHVVVDLAGFQPCKAQECETVCGVKNKTLGYCDDVNKKVHTNAVMPLAISQLLSYN